MVGRHIISVSILGNNRDLNRALASSSREVNKMAREFRKLNGDVDGAGAAFERFRQHESMRITITEKVERARVGFRRLSTVTALSAAGLGLWQTAAAVAGLAAASLSGLLVGAAGAGLVGAFAKLWLSTEKAQKEMAKLGNYIRDDLINKTMKPFYDEVAKLPDVLRDSFDAAKPQFEELGKALKPLMKDLNDALPGIIKKVAQLFTSVAEAARPFFKGILDGLPLLISGFKRFFDAFKNDGDPTVIKKVFRDIGDAVAGLGKFLAGLDASDYERFKEVIINASTGLINAFKTINTVVNKADEFLGKFGLSFYEVAGAAAAFGIAMRVFGPVLKVFNGAWQLFNKLKLATALRGLLGVSRPLLGVITRFAGPIGLIVTAATGWLWVFKEINTEGSKLNEWWKGITSSDAWNTMVDAFNEFKDAVGEALSTLKKAWDDTWSDLEDAGVIDTLKTVLGALADVALFILGEAFKGALTFLTQTFKIATVGVKAFVEIIKFALDGVKTFVDIVTGNFGEFKRSTHSAWDGASNAVSSSVDAIKDKIDTIANIVSTVVGYFNSIKDGASEKLTGLVSYVKEIPGKVLDAIGDVSSTLLTKGRNFIGGLLQGIRDKFFGENGVGDSVREWLVDLPSKVLEKIGDIGSTLIEKGKSLLGGLLRGIRDKFFGENGAADNIKDWLVDLPNKVLEKVGDIGGTLIDKGRNLLGGLLQGIRDKFFGENGVTDGIKGWLSDIGNKILGLIPNEAKNNPATWLIEVGKNVIAGLIAGFWAKMVAVKNALSKIAGNVVQWFKDALGIRSPSKVFMGFGKNIGEGLVLGLGKSETPVAKATESLANEVKSVGDLSQLVQVDSSTLQKVWQAEIDAAKSATDELATIWKAWGKEYESILKSAGVSTNTNYSTPVLTNPSSTTSVVENRTYNISVTSNSPNAGREIVQEIQKFERINGRSWRS